MNGVQVAELIVRPTEGFPGQLPLGGVLENRETLREFDRIAHQVDHRQMAAILGRTRRQVNANRGMVCEPTLWVLQFREQPRE